MKKLLCFCLLLGLALNLHAQTQQDAQKQLEQARKQLEKLKSDPAFQQKMQMAKEAQERAYSNPEVQKQLVKSNAMLDSMKKTHPELANVPDLTMGKFQMPDMDSMESMLEKTGNQLQAYTKSIAQTTPKLNVFHHAEKLSVLTNATITEMANKVLKNAKANLDVLSVSNLNKMLKDTSINIASIGAFLLTTDGSKKAALFLICKGIIINPRDTWAVNDLGVYFRDKMDYENSLRCFFYANKLDTGKAAAINTNIGWAAAYYGDFDAAKKYFDKALAIDKSFQSALEGEAMLAYAKGDIAALFQCLAKGIKNLGGGSSGSGGDNGPSDAFASTCGGIFSENQPDLDNQTTDPNSDHTFDNPNPDGGNSKDPLPDANVDDITYTRYKKIFISDPKKLLNFISEYAKQEKQSYDELAKRSTALTQQLKTLKPLVQSSYIDNDGNLIYPNSFRKYVELLTPIEESFEMRLAWYINKLEKKLVPLRKDVVKRDNNMYKQYIDALEACTGKGDVCANGVNCIWIPRMYKSKSDDIAAVAKLWNDYYDNAAKAIQWYIDASAPFISHVHDAGWNSYLNAKREFEVRKAIIQAYGIWGSAIGDIIGITCGVIEQTAPPCPAAQMFAHTQAPDPFSKKPKHIKEFEGPCYSMNFNMLIGGIQSTCHGDKFYIGTSPTKMLNPLGISLNAFYARTTDQIAAQNQGFSNEIGGSVGVSKSFGVVSVGVDGKASAQFDDNWQFTGGSTRVDAKVGIGPGVATAFSLGKNTTFQVVAGQIEMNTSNTLNGPSNTSEPPNGVSF